MPELPPLELLAPARDFACGKAAVDSGADAVYIAGPAFGAREAAGNSMEEVARLVDYSRRFGVKTYLTLNTLLYSHEIEAARLLSRQAWEAGCAALIIQDPRLLEVGLPPIPLFASTQMDNRTVEQVQRLERLGFERVILARELTLNQIAQIRAHTSVALEFFVHGALCVSFSGRCYLSEALTENHPGNNRSANRGACIQACRNRYHLEDASGRILVRDQHLLSLRDLRLDQHLGSLIDSGITSFKVEGRLKNSAYVKNIVAHYRQRLDAVINERNAASAAVVDKEQYTAAAAAVDKEQHTISAAASDKEQHTAAAAAVDKEQHTISTWRKASLGRIAFAFEPNPERTFSRGHTLYNIGNRRDSWCTMTHGKARGEEIGAIAGNNFMVSLHNHITLSVGDGVCWLNPQGEWVGSVINAIAPASAPNQRMIKLQNAFPVGADNTLYRTFDRLFEKALAHPKSAQRIMDVEVEVEIGVQPETYEQPETSQKFDEQQETYEQQETSQKFDEQQETYEQQETSQKFDEQPETYEQPETSQKFDEQPETYKQQATSQKFDEQQETYEQPATPQTPDKHLVTLRAHIPGGAAVTLSIPCHGTPARDAELANRQIRTQLEKTVDNLYLFHVTSLTNHSALFFPAARINAWRRCLGAALFRASTRFFAPKPSQTQSGTPHRRFPPSDAQALAELKQHIPPAGEIPDTLMQCTYCIKYELGYCQKESFYKPFKEPLYLVNQGKRLKLLFDCTACEMRVLQK